MDGRCRGRLVHPAHLVITTGGSLRLTHAARGQVVRPLSRQPGPASWPPAGNSRGHQRAVRTATHGPILLTLDTAELRFQMVRSHGRAPGRLRRGRPQHGVSLLPGPRAGLAPARSVRTRGSKPLPYMSLRPNPSRPSGRSGPSCASVRLCPRTSRAPYAHTPSKIGRLTKRLIDEVASEGRSRPQITSSPTAQVSAPWRPDTWWPCRAPGAGR